MINEQNWEELSKQFLSAEPFNHVIIDNFWNDNVAEQLVADFPSYESPVWHAHYHNAIEDKKACNHWDKFPKATYQAFNFLGSEVFLNLVRRISDKHDLTMDMGLHGGGWHAHANGGNLNIHLDYNIHPKLELQRKLNIIIYLVKDWDTSYGGGLELWSHDAEKNKPKHCVKKVDLKFNRAVLFDTTQNSWHGLPYPLTCPENKIRQSMAAYYVGPAPANTDDRPRARFAPREDQVGNKEIEDLIVSRSSLSTVKVG